MHGSRRCFFLYRETHKGDIVNGRIKAVAKVSAVDSLKGGFFSFFMYVI